ncbi:MAG: hypothetical protein KJ709_05735 [Nanoarchaeota archaeon]|nr:hypothetical protein [Nanoarchaeota archaeon]
MIKVLYFDAAPKRLPEIKEKLIKSLEAQAGIDLDIIQPEEWTDNTITRVLVERLKDKDVFLVHPSYVHQAMILRYWREMIPDIKFAILTFLTKWYDEEGLKVLDYQNPDTIIDYVLEGFEK